MESSFPNFKVENSSNMSRNCDDSVTQSYITNSSQEGDYLGGQPRFIAYFATRCCQIVIGIIANVLTLLILKKLRRRLNVHVIMAYLATSDILVSCILPVTIYLDASRIELVDYEYFWDKVCIIKEFSEMVFMMICIFSYLLLSFDR